MTPNKEEYLKAIDSRAGGTELASNEQLSDALNVAPTSVSEMLVRLQKEGLIAYRSEVENVKYTSGEKACHQ